MYGDGWRGAQGNNEMVLGSRLAEMCAHLSYRELCGSRTSKVLLIPGAATNFVYVTLNYS